MSGFADFDDRDQLTGADYDSGPTDESYGYDENGNRDTGGFTVDTNNRLLSDGTYDYEYDDEGNLTKRTHKTSYDSTHYTWDHRNRLSLVLDYAGNGTASTGDDTVTQIVVNTYDAFNQWIAQTVDTDGNPGTTADVIETVFVYHEGQIVLEFSDTGAGDLAAGDLAHRYLWAQAVDQLLADEVVGGDTLWALTDHLGSVRDVVDSNGTLRKHTVYDSFGQVTGEEYFDSAGDPIGAGHAEAIAQLFGYTGRPRDEATGLQNNLHRWYDASTGKWLSEDPIGFAARDANFYRYVGNEPTNVTDRNGLFGESAWGLSNGADFGNIDDGLLEPIELPWKDWFAWGTDNAGTEIFIDPETGRIWGQGGSAGSGSFGRLRDDNFVPDGAIDLPDEPPTFDLALEAAAGAGKFVKGRGVLGSASKRGGRTFDDILNNDDVFKRWLKHKKPANQPLSPDDASKVWEKLKQLGKNPRLDQGHAGTQWDMPHINVDGTHIPVDLGFTPK